MSGIWQRAQRIERQALAAVTHHPYDHPQEVPMAATLADAIHADITRAIEQIVGDIVSRYLNDPRNLAHALTDALDTHQPAIMQAPLPPLPPEVQPADPDADPAA